MNEGQENPKDLIDTTDCLEAIGVFKCWKNFLFVIIILCLLLLQLSFWLVNTGCIKTDSEFKNDEPVVVTESGPPADKATTQDTAVPPKIVAITEPNQPQEAKIEKPIRQKINIGALLKFEYLATLIRLVNFVLVPASVLYCLTMLFALKVSLLGRLGGINHITRAFFLSLVLLMLLLPWQLIFPGIAIGLIYMPEELLSSFATVKTSQVPGLILLYLRFTGYWLVVMLLLVFSQFRSIRWTKATLRRLEII